MRRAIFLLVFVAAALSTGRAAAEERSFDLDGTWGGSILFEEGRIELDMTVRFERSDAGWKAILDLPLVGVRDHDVEQVEVTSEGFRLRFEMADGGGERTIAGRLPAEGGRIEGTFTQGLQEKPILLHRVDREAAQQPVEVEELAGLAALRERFRSDADDVRLLLLLSPS